MIYIANIIRDQKFIDAQIAYHDLTLDICTHDYFIVSWDKNISFKYMCQSHRVIIVTPDELIYRLTTNHYDALFIHNFLYMPLHYMSKIPKHIKVFWFSWGYDIYNTPKNSPFISIPLLHKKSLDLLKKLHSQQSKLPLFSKFKHYVKWHISSLISYKKLDHNNVQSIYKAAVKRVDYYSGVFPIEYELMKTKPQFRAKKVTYNYINPSEWVSDTEKLPLIGNNILIGNSADINNNHLDVLDYFENINLQKRKVIVPLSYGGSQQYIQPIVEAYTTQLQDSFMPLLDFMPIDKYLKLLSSVGVAIFFQERQQAAGNISELLKTGVKVFLSETSINYKHYKSLGYHVYSLQTDFNQNAIETPLTKEEKLHNISLWRNINNKEVRLNQLYTIYNIIKQSSHVSKLSN